MSLPITLLDGKGTGVEATVTTSTNGFETPDGLVVYADDLLHWNPKSYLFADELGSIEMAVNASIGGTPELIHNGTDTVAWTASVLSGSNWIFDSTDQAQDGTQSIRARGTANGDEALITAGSTVDLSNYSLLTGYVYLDRYNVNRHGIELRFRLAGVDEGNSIDLNDYVNTGNLDVWQKFAIPKADMGLGGETIDELVVQTIHTSGNTSRYYLDVVQLDQSGGVAYTVEPDLNTTFMADALRFQFTDAYAGTLADATMSNLSYDQILGVTLSGPIVLQRTRKGEVAFAFAFTNLSDLLLAGMDIKTAISDGTNTSITLDIIFPSGIQMDEKQGDKVAISFAQDLTGLISYRALVIGRELIPHKL
tara:strand:+ start:2885 stop:3979 length:1095 start_codon:yes stop_codon:yes gene_type:complete